MCKNLIVVPTKKSPIRWGGFFVYKIIVDNIYSVYYTFNILGGDNMNVMVVMAKSHKFEKAVDQNVAYVFNEFGEQVLEFISCARDFYEFNEDIKMVIKHFSISELKEWKIQKYVDAEYEEEMVKC